MNWTRCLTSTEATHTVRSVFFNTIASAYRLHRYCRKRTIAVECMNNLTVAIEPCLDAQEVGHKKTFVNIFTNLLNFVCHKDGDQIALFIAEKGPECFKDKQEALTRCFNETFSEYAVHNVTLDTLPLLVVGAKECK